MDIITSCTDVITMRRSTCFFIFLLGTTFLLILFLSGFYSSKDASKIIYDNAILSTASYSAEAANNFPLNTIRVLSLGNGIVFQDYSTTSNPTRIIVTWTGTPPGPGPTYVLTYKPIFPNNNTIIGTLTSTFLMSSSNPADTVIEVQCGIAWQSTDLNGQIVFNTISESQYFIDNTTSGYINISIPYRVTFTQDQVDDNGGYIGIVGYNYVSSDVVIGPLKRHVKSISISACEEAS